jgi:hypothetical protein
VRGADRLALLRTGRVGGSGAWAAFARVRYRDCVVGHGRSRAGLTELATTLACIALARTALARTRLASAGLAGLARAGLRSAVLR